MSIPTEKKETTDVQLDLRPTMKYAVDEKNKLVQELWEYCRKYPNDT